jgi:hypothetical protein
MNATLPVLSRSPRAVPLSTRLVVLFGGPLSTFGWFFFSFGMLLFWLLGWNADWTAPVLFRGPLQTASGRVTASEKTRFSEGGGKHGQGTPVYRHRYRFTFNGTEYQDVSYCTGGSPERAGDTVTVEFPESRPARSRLRGMRRAPLSLIAGFVLVFLAAGLLAVMPGILLGRKSIRLLSRGELAQGRRLKKEATRMEENKRTVYKLTFEFTDALGQTRPCVIKTSRLERLEDDRVELILYDPQQPSRALPLDSLPEKQGFDLRGGIPPSSLWRAFKSSLPPLVALLVVTGGIVVKFFW